MSSTEQRTRRFFRRRLLPAAEALRARGVRFFPLGPEEGSREDPGEPESYYVAGPSGEPEFVELELADCEAALRELWQGEGLPELAALAGPLMELAGRLEVPEEEAGEVSPFVYVMY